MITIEIPEWMALTIVAAVSINTALHMVVSYNKWRQSIGKRRAQRQLRRDLEKEFASPSRPDSGGPETYGGTRVGAEQ